MTNEYNLKRKIPTPDFYCESCSKFQNKRCTFYGRPVKQDNRCFNHSFYHTVATKYQSPENIAEIAQSREDRVA